MYVPLVLRWACSLSLGAVFLLIFSVVISWILMAINHLFAYSKNKTSRNLNSREDIHLAIQEKKSCETVALQQTETASTSEEEDIMIDDHDSEIFDAGDAGDGTENKDDGFDEMMPEIQIPIHDVDLTSWRNRENLPLPSRGNRPKFSLENLKGGGEGDSI